VNHEQPTRCTKCYRPLPSDHDGWPLCVFCAYKVRQAKIAQDLAKRKKKKLEAKEPAIREFALRDICVG